MAKSEKISLKLLIDDKRNKVILAEADQDFVDVLISLLSLPMGKIANCLRNVIILGCFKNLNQSVADMGTEYFETETCKSMLLNPKSTKGIHCKRLKVNMNYNVDTSLYVCSNFLSDMSCTNAYSNFNTLRCRCGALMNDKIDIPDKEIVGEVIGDNADGVFVNCCSSFIVTDDLKVSVNSIGVIKQVLTDQGYLRLTDLREVLLDVGFEEMLSLVGCLFTSETPLTSTFLKQNRTTKMNKTLSPQVEKVGDSRLYSVKVFVRKIDREILHVECNENFIDSLVSFLVLPLELAHSLSNDNTIFRCVGNLCRSPIRRASASSFYQFPYFYNCNNNNPFQYKTYTSPVYECLIPSGAVNTSSCKFTRQINRLCISPGERNVNLYQIDPKAKKGTLYSKGFVKRDTKFIVSNDLVISPMKSSSVLDILKKIPLGLCDIEEHQITISKNELISILRASLISSSALTKGLSGYLTKNVKEET